GFAHPLIGALVAKKWNFSAETCQIILHYSDPIEGNAPESPLEEKTAIVQLADQLSHRADIGNPEGYPVDNDEIIRLMVYLGFDKDDAPDTLEDIVSKAKEQFEAEKHVYG